jgi:uncharacterized repeat protein (TIGR01451 family)
MKTVFARKSIPLALPLASLVVLVILLFGSTELLEAGPQEQEAQGKPVRALNRSALLDYQPGVPICEQAYNSVRNPGFEEGIGPLNGWVETGKCIFLWEDSGHSGNSSARILTTDGLKKDCKLMTIIEEIPVIPGRHYDYSAWVRTDLQAGDANLTITFWEFQGSAWKTVDLPALTNPVSDTQSAWVQVTGSVLAPEGAQYARVEATLTESGQGSVWFDDVYFGLSTCLDVVKIDEPHAVPPGQLLTYTITYSNTGREGATGVRIVEAYDKDVDFSSAQPPPDIGNSLWTIGNLGPGVSGTITATVRVENEAEDRNFLFNTVSLLSNETFEPISMTLPTRVITPDTCAIYVDPPFVTGSGRLGQVMHYELTLRNAGERDGQAVLTAASSQGWSFGFSPPTHTLPVSISKPVSFSLEIPADLPGRTQDVSLVTATLSCINDQSATDTSTVTTSVTIPIMLPTVLRNARDRFWEIEPNNSCAEANGPISPGRQYFGYPDDNRDVFSIDLPSSGELDVSLEIHDGDGVQLHLLESNNGECETIAYDWDPPFHVKHTLGPGRFYIGIFVEEPEQDPNRAYTLQADFP